MKIRIVLSVQNAAWIIGKIAERLGDELRRAGAEVTVGDKPDDSADINHWMSYAFVERRAGRASTVFVTHIDDPYKKAQLNDLLGSRADLGLCMSRDTMQSLVAQGIPAARVWYVSPAHDAPPEPARIRIAITTRLYDDGRKREAFLLELARERDLSPFHFEIAGAGWEDVVPLLREAGASVHWEAGGSDYQADYQAILEGMRSCRYYLYLGMDEGSLGTLDALALGLETIVTPQGFHLDIRGGITEPVEKYEEFRDVMDRLAQARQARIDSVRNWTWPQFAADHLLVWQALLDGKQSQLAKVLEGQGRYGEIAPTAPRVVARKPHYARLLSPRRMLGAIGRMRFLQPLRRALKR
jgi:hypothetical protein